MSKLFSKLITKPASKVWTEVEFEQLFNDPKCYDFRKALGDSKAVWAAWYSFLERKKLCADYTVNQPCWLLWLYFEQLGGRSLDHLNLPPALLKQFCEFKTFRDAKKAKEDKERSDAEQERRAAWRQEYKRIKVQNEGTRLAYRTFHSQEDLDLYQAGKQDIKDCRLLVEETPFDTTQSQIQEHRVMVETGPDRGRLLDIMVECTNYGLTYSEEDIKAVNEGKKKLENCKLIVKAYPTPVITVNEDLKRKYIDAYNRPQKEGSVRPVCFYERSDAQLLGQKRKTERSAVDMAKEFLEEGRAGRRRRPWYPSADERAGSQGHNGTSIGKPEDGSAAC